MQLNKYSIGSGPNLSTLFLNEQVWPKVMTTPLLFPMETLVSTNIKLSSNPATVEMNVNGSVTPQVFEYVVPADRYFALFEMDLIIVDTSITMEKFGGLPALTNGILWQIVDGSNVEKYSWGSGQPIKANFQFYNNPGTSLQLGQGGDHVNAAWTAANLGLTGVLQSGWKIRIVVRDDLTGLQHFQASVHGFLMNTDYQLRY